MLQEIAEKMSMLRILEDLILYWKFLISPKYHIYLTGDFDFSTGFHRPPAVISTADKPRTVLNSAEQYSTTLKEERISRQTCSKGVLNLR